MPVTLVLVVYGVLLRSRVVCHVVWAMIYMITLSQITTRCDEPLTNSVLELAATALHCIVALAPHLTTLQLAFCGISVRRGDSMQLRSL